MQIVGASTTPLEAVRRRRAQSQMGTEDSTISLVLLLDRPTGVGGLGSGAAKLSRVWVRERGSREVGGNHSDADRLQVVATASSRSAGRHDGRGVIEP
jgi:hypothetical protein